MNFKKVDLILSWLAENAVKCICLCPGGRNGAFVEALETSEDFEVLTFYDERSAGFFALGRAKRDQTPVAVITTSGTAVTEVMSSVVEADYSGVPLVVITADRPKALRGTGAPQSIDQNNIFGSYVEACIDIEDEDKISAPWKQNQPLHINICFDEPIIDGEWEKKSYKINKAKKRSLPKISPMKLKKPILVLGGMNEGNANAVAESLQGWQGPIFAESLSQLKNFPALKDKQILSGDRFVQKLLKEKVVDSVLRVGDVPVGRYWRDLDELKIPTLSINTQRFKGTAHSELVVGDLEQLESGDLQCESWDWSEWKEKDFNYSQQIQKLFECYPLSEASNYLTLSQLSQNSDMAYLGNSLPIRLWDLVGGSQCQVQANRGVNGIDGQISSAFGLVKPQTTNWVVLGDLTTLYDMSGFWMSPYLKKIESKVRCVVMNNLGGQIFSRMFKSPLFLNRHSLNFKPMADMWGWDYQQTQNVADLKELSDLQLIEINPNAEQTKQFWDDYDQVWKK